MPIDIYLYVYIYIYLYVSFYLSRNNEITKIAIIVLPLKLFKIVPILDAIYLVLNRLLSYFTFFMGI